MKIKKLNIYENEMLMTYVFRQKYKFIKIFEVSYENFNKEKTLKSSIEKLAKLGYEIDKKITPGY